MSPQPAARPADFNGSRVVEHTEQIRRRRTCATTCVTGSRRRARSPAGPRRSAERTRRHPFSLTGNLPPPLVDGVTRLFSRRRPRNGGAFAGEWLLRPRHSSIAIEVIRTEEHAWLLSVSNYCRPVSRRNMAGCCALAFRQTPSSLPSKGVTTLFLVGAGP